MGLLMHKCVPCSQGKLPHLIDGCARAERDIVITARICGRSGCKSGCSYRSVIAWNESERKVETTRHASCLSAQLAFVRNISRSGDRDRRSETHHAHTAVMKHLSVPVELLYIDESTRKEVGARKPTCSLIRLSVPGSCEHGMRLV